MLIVGISLCFILLAVYFSYINNTKQQNYQQNNYREIQYLEYSIIGGNSPFNNYRTNNQFTLLSIQRIKNIRKIMEDIIKNNIKGDVIEAGNWRGGAMLFARGILKAYGINDKQIWMFDTFSGFPKASAIIDKKEITLVKGKGADKLKSNSVNKVKELFNKYNLSDNVNIIQGDFHYTLYRETIPLLSYLRLDADSYTNTKFLLEMLYNKLNKNGYVEFDDYGAFPGCKKAVDEFREKNKITNEIKYVYDFPGKSKFYDSIYWKK